RAAVRRRSCNSLLWVTVGGSPSPPRSMPLSRGQRAISSWLIERCPVLGMREVWCVRTFETPFSFWRASLLSERDPSFARVYAVRVPLRGCADCWFHQNCPVSLGRRDVLCHRPDAWVVLALLAGFPAFRFVCLVQLRVDLVDRLSRAAAAGDCGARLDDSAFGESCEGLFELVGVGEKAAAALCVASVESGLEFTCHDLFVEHRVDFLSA